MIVGDIFRRIGKVVKQLFAKKSTIENAFSDVSIAMSGKMVNAIQEWAEMYEDNPPWLSDVRGATLNLPATIAAEIARLVTMEMVVKVSGSPMADYINDQISGCISNARKYTEYACAKGGIALKPYVIPDSGKIAITVVQAEDFYPTDFDSDGNITGAIFPDQKIDGNKKYTRLERHELNGTTYTIENKVFVTEVSEINDNNDNIIGKEIDLEDVPGWESIEEMVTIEDIEKPLFAYFKMPMANNVEVRSPLGVSVFSKAAKTIKEADNQWANILWEYFATQAGIFGDEDIFDTDECGRIKLADKDQRLFRVFSNLEEKLKEYNPNIRDVSLFNGLNNILKRVEFQSQLAYGTLSDPSNVDKTAEEIKQSKQRSFSLVCDIQKEFQTAHENLIYAVYALATMYELAPDGEYESQFEFDDSIAVDREKEFNHLMQMAAAKMLRPEVVLAWYFGTSEEEAKKLMPDAFDESDEDDEPPVHEEE